MKPVASGTVRTLALIDARMRLRRPATLVVMLAVAALTWLMISDPLDGRTLIASHGARVLYSSSAIALGSASLATLLFSLAGFYLLRGRTAQDLRLGLGGVIGASPAGGAAFILGRWCGGLLYQFALFAAFAATILLCHAVRGEGPLQPLVYLQTFVLVLGPMALFTAGCAVLFDSWAPLMGKLGDVLYFFVWMVQIGMLSSVTDTGHTPSAIPVDFTGMSAIVTALSFHFDFRDTMLGIADFDRHLAPLTLPDWLWSGQLVAMRALAAVLALAPLLLSLTLFHRYSPDRVKATRARTRRSPLALLNGWLRPLARLSRPLLLLAARVPGLPGQALADAALTLATSPVAIALLLAAQVTALALDLHQLPALACVAVWGVLASDLPTRDLDAGCASLGAAVPGGDARRYWRHLLASLMLGLLFSGLAALRLALAMPLRAAALLAGVAALAALASLLGRASGTARTFLTLFLFGLYVNVNAARLAPADVVGFQGAATPGSVLGWACVGLAAAWGGHLWRRRA
jgi:hypothetical protein